MIALAWSEYRYRIMLKQFEFYNVQLESYFEMLKLKSDSQREILHKIINAQAEVFHFYKLFEKDLEKQSTEFMRLHVDLADVKETVTAVTTDIDRHFQKNIDALISARKSNDSHLDNLKQAFKKPVRDDT